MGMKWTRSIAKSMVVAVLLTILFNVVYYSVSYFNASKMLETRLNDIAMVVAEENCMSRVGVSGGYSDSSMKRVADMLTISESPTFRFSTVVNTGSWSKGEYGKAANIDWALSVTRDTGSDVQLDNYDKVVQRGVPIKIKLRGTLSVPMLLFTHWNVDGNNGTIIEKEYIVLGTRFYKGI